jgi:hypothetical protein
MSGEPGGFLFAAIGVIDRNSPWQFRENGAIAAA